MLDYDSKVHKDWYITAYNLGCVCKLGNGKESDNPYSDPKKFTAWQTGFREQQR